MNIAKLFDEAAESYDATRKKYIPCIADLYGILVEQIPYHTNDEFSVLDLGAGTGLLTSLVRKSFPNARYTLADVSSEMLNQAKIRFTGDESIVYHELDFEKDQIPGSYNVVISALALHHTPIDQLCSVFGEVYNSLQPGGIFLNADQILGTTPQIENSYVATWLRHARAADCTDKEIEVAMERMKADRTSTLKDQLEGLEKVGFQDVNCWYQFYRFATYSGVRV